MKTIFYFLTPSLSWQSSGVSCSPQRRRTYRRAWWTTSACSSLFAAAPSAPPSAPSYRRCHRLKATSTTTDAAVRRAHALSYSNAVTCSDFISTMWTTVHIFFLYTAAAQSCSSAFEAESLFPLRNSSYTIWFYGLETFLILSLNVYSFN